MCVCGFQMCTPSKSSFKDVHYVLRFTIITACTIALVMKLMVECQTFFFLLQRACFSFYWPNSLSHIASVFVALTVRSVHVCRMFVCILCFKAEHHSSTVMDGCYMFCQIHCSIHGDKYKKCWWWASMGNHGAQLLMPGRLCLNRAAVYTPHQLHVLGWVY